LISYDFVIFNFFPLTRYLKESLKFIYNLFLPNLLNTRAGHSDLSAWTILVFSLISKSSYRCSNKDFT